MNPNLNWRRLLVLLAVLALVATGCRGAEETAAPDEDDDAGAATQPAGATEAEGTEAAGDAATGGEVATDVGVTQEPCTNAVNPDNGCIYLGVISDFTGTFSALGVPIAEAIGAFWQRVNEEGGIGGYDIDAVTYVEDNGYNPETHNDVYQQMKPEVLALGLSLGSPTTSAIQADLESSAVVTVPAGWTSAYVFQDVVIESGTNYCIEAINSVAWAQENVEGVETVLAIHYAGDYGADAAYGAQVAAQELGLEFTAFETTPGQDNQAGAVSAVVDGDPDLVIVTTGPTDLAVIVGQAAAGGYQGQYIGTSPTWNPGLLQTPAADALRAQYLQSSPWGSYDSDTPGHQAMRELLGDEGNEGLTSGWIWQYPMKAALEAAVENGDLTRQGLLDAATALESVDYEGMLPEGSGNFAAGEAFPRQNIIHEIDESFSTGLARVTEDFYSSEIAEEFDYGGSPCFQQL